MFSVFTISYIIIYRRKNEKHRLEMKNIKLLYEQASLQSQLEMQEHTFNTISNEIHDNVGQILSLAKVQLNIIDQSDKLDKALLADVKDSVAKAMADLRDIAKSLNSERIQQSGLFENTKLELQRINRAGIMNTSITSEGSKRDPAEQNTLILFRMIQEALHNIIKHSKAAKATVCFDYQPEYLRILLSDNGIGFDADQIAGKDGLGLKNMIKRATMIGGEVTIKSRPREGTVITIKSPYE
jgi:signal transduction histidine kinase